MVVFGLFKFPSGKLVVDTGVSLKSDEENFVHVLDLWSSQVRNIKECQKLFINKSQAKTFKLGKFKISEENVIASPMKYSNIKFVSLNI